MPNGSLSLAATLYLLAFDPGTGKPVTHLGYLVQAGALTELAQRELLVDADGRPRPLPDARTGDPALDGLLEVIEESRPRSWGAWVGHETRLTERAVRHQLRAAGYVRATSRRRVLGLFPVKEYAVERPQLVAGMRDEAVRVLYGDRPASEVSERDAALIALAAAGGLTTVVTHKDLKAHRQRIAELEARSGAPGAALEGVVDHVRAGLAAAVATALSAATAVTTTTTN
ncbi:GPP34 family phosphoprotein [Streptomyces sp. NPDC021212]|uniref:GOLPH3/VPS74 family protein n=1 Tax=Streptomyces sp. NPDC021212 TaxID=3365118 RepID=UPI0037A3C3D4